MGPPRHAPALVAALLLFALPCRAVKEITAAEARHHIGENVTICGKVASTNYAASSRGQPTFLNLDRAYPNHIFTIVIWGENRPKFTEPPERHFRNKRVCVTGDVSSYRGSPQIIVDRPGQIRTTLEIESRTLERSPAPSGNCIPRSSCCRVCRVGKACGNSFISAKKTCHKGAGCACDSWMVCT